MTAHRKEPVGLVCQRCRAATVGVVLCNRCRETASHALRNLAENHEKMFGIGETRPRVRRRSGAADPIGAQVTADPQRDSSAEAAALEVTAMLSGWVRVLIDDRASLAWPGNNVTAMTVFLHENLRTIAVLEWAGAMLNDLLQFEARLRRIVSAHEGHWSAGPCGAPAPTEDDPAATCDRELMVHPATRYLRCPRCGTNWSVDVRRRKVIEQARDQLLPVSLIARTAVALLPGEMSVQRLESRLRKWVERDQLDDYGVRWVAGQPRRVYKLGEVLDRLVRERADFDASRATVASSVTFEDVAPAQNQVALSTEPDTEAS